MILGKPMGPTRISFYKAKPVPKREQKPSYCSIPTGKKATKYFSGTDPWMVPERRVSLELWNRITAVRRIAAIIRIDPIIISNTIFFLRFADFFFDGLFADWVVLDHIHHSQQQVESTLSQIENLLSQLKATQSNTEGEIARLSAARDELVRNAQL